MRHDFDTLWKNADCDKNGIMSYYDPRLENDAKKIRLVTEIRSEGIWTDCNLKDLKDWWNNFGKYSSYISFHNTSKGNNCG